MSTQDTLKTVNEALARLGSAPIAALDEETPKAAKVAQIYPTVVGAAFACHRWNWARRTARLDRLAVTPETGWRYAYALPGDRIGEPVKVMLNPRAPDYLLRAFALEGDELHADELAVWATFVRSVEPEQWPALFRAAIVVALAADLAVPLTHDVTLKQQLAQDAWGTPSEGGRGGLMGRAMAVDASAQPGSTVLARDPLTDAWHGAY